jgi:hypothetical protein
MGVLSPAMSPALTADHHHPRPAKISSATGGQMSDLPAAPRTSLALNSAPTASSLDPLWHRGEDTAGFCQA